MPGMRARGNVVPEQTFFRFPHTPHLAWLGDGTPRDDKVLSDIHREKLLSNSVCIEEKVDGANLGISLDQAGNFRVQNRGQYLRPPYPDQFSRLDAWLERKGEALFDGLTSNLLVFGEWCAARHSLSYDSLPDWWLVFDIYDRNLERFWEPQRRDSWARACGLSTVSALGSGHFSLAELVTMVNSRDSSYRDGPLEGLVVRSSADGWTSSRAKLVRADFVQGICSHWRDRSISWNRLR